MLQSSNKLLEFWFKALRSPVGLVLYTDDIERLRQKLYTVRAQYDGHELDDLFLSPSPLNPHELWIVHKRITPDAQEG